jgi:hypothetical protein
MALLENEENQAWHHRHAVYKSLRVDFIHQWCDDPKTKFTVDLVNGSTYGGAVLVDVSEPRPFGECGVPNGPIWLDFEFEDGEHVSIPITAIVSVTWKAE